jgi:hypothetical protein
MTPDRASIILARHKACQIIRDRHRSAGRKLPQMRELRDDADQYLAAHREELIAWSKSVLSAPKSGR